MIYIGIDPGVSTGYAVYDSHLRKLLEMQTWKIHEAMDAVRRHVTGIAGYIPIKVRFEDARQRTWFGQAGREQLQGAGSIKRDCLIWEDFLDDLRVDFLAVKPQKGMTKWSPTQLTRLTGWTGRTSEHARDAALLVWGMT